MTYDQRGAGPWAYLTHPSSTFSERAAGLMFFVVMLSLCGFAMAMLVAVTISYPVGTAITISVIVVFFAICGFFHIKGASSRG